ncbi:hypothetical protein VFPFJ_11678 [Purpureocillium lilacinum]|uniref:Uncharacterized protein n=1 Tax=Purpureocillium lilacinum TaxID=33203 RepID=A0A179EZB7_PURLI|nr:hypothetical protein VFPFJ_11678 [Purpureocillium lilacinum]OAQ58183.1 hypothetical protein VFPFJ_11678 [Purpureocillium lilacinum]
MWPTSLTCFNTSTLHAPHPAPWHRLNVTIASGATSRMLEIAALQRQLQRTCVMQVRSREQG